MKRRAAGLVLTLLALAGIWGSILAVAYVAGLLPSEPAAGSDAGSDGGASAADAAMVSPDGGEPSAPIQRDAGTTDGGGPAGRDGGPGAPPPSEGPRLGTSPSDGRGDAWRLSENGEGGYVLRSIAIGMLFDGPRPTVVVATDRVSHVFAVLADGHLLRTHTIAMEETREDVLVGRGRPAIGDVTGDGRADLVIPFWKQSTRGGSRGGGVYLLAGRPGNQLASPVRLGARFAAQSVAMVELDGRPGLELVVGDRGLPYSEHPEAAVRLFRGGRRPTEAASRPSGIFAGGVVVLDLGLDSTLDVVAYGEWFAMRFATTPAPGLGEGARVPDAYEAVAADLDGDGHRDLVLRGVSTMMWIPASDRSFNTRTVADSYNLRPCQAIDADRDGREDVLVVSGMDRDVIGLLDGRRHRLASLAADDRGSALASDPRAQDVIDAALADLDSDGVLDLVALVDRGGEQLWVVRSMPVAHARLDPTERAVDDAPTLTAFTVR